MEPIVLRGNYGEAHVYAKTIENQLISQCIDLLNHPMTEGNKIRIMPDTHAGKGCMIGTTMQVKDQISPNLVGVDIGCGMLTVEIGKEGVDFERLDQIVTDFVPLGFRSHQEETNIATKFFSENEILADVDLETPLRGIGTLGGGNHFIEVNEDETGNKYLVIHTGSRNLGKQVAEYWQKVAIEEQETTLEKVNKDLATLKGENLEKYLKDMKTAQKYATLNRETIADAILTEYFGEGLENFEHFETVHNYINTEENILRKGAISAKLGEKVLIPLNMRDGSLIAVGKGNAEWNESAPHGAGRLMSRGEAKRKVNLEDFERSMEGIFSTSVGASTLDESPFAYKDSEEIKEIVQDTVDIVSHIKPIYNRKA